MFDSLSDYILHVDLSSLILSLLILRRECPHTGTRLPLLRSNNCSIKTNSHQLRVQKQAKRKLLSRLEMHI